MKLKVLIVPALAVLILILIIGYIKPDWDTLNARKAVLKEKEAEAANIETVLGNIDAMNSALDADSGTEDFILRYFPDMLDQGRVIDAFNFLVTQTGLLVIGVEVNEPVKSELPEESIAAGTPAGLLGEVALSADGTPLPPAYTPPVPRNYSAKVTAQGSYENIKGLLEKLNRMDRIRSVEEFSIGLNEKALQDAAAGEAVPATGELVVTFKANFQYLIPHTGTNALQAPVFKESSLDLAAASQARERITGDVPDLNVVPGGKPNPFQLGGGAPAPAADANAEAPSDL